MHWKIKNKNNSKRKLTYVFHPSLPVSIISSTLSIQGPGTELGSVFNCFRPLTSLNWSTTSFPSPSLLFSVPAPTQAHPCFHLVSGSQSWAILPPGHSWQCLKTFLLSPREYRCGWIPCNKNSSLITKHDQIQMPSL